MATVRISQFKATPASNTQGLSKTVLDNLEKSHDPSTYAIGTQIQDASIVQLTSQGEGTEILQTVQQDLGEPQSTFTITLNKPVFGSAAPAKGPVLEFVQSWFPVSRLTPEYMKSIEQDFDRFHEIFRRTAKENLGTSYGWFEEVEHEEILGEKARSFAVLVGWDRMSDFEESTGAEGFKEALPILMAWSVPAKMTHVQNWS